MSNDFCYGFVCFFRLDANAPKFFGFSEFLAGLALMVLAWTIGDVRYRFRVFTAPLPLQKTTFAVVAVVGILTLLTDLWRAEQWPVPRGNVLTPSIWQAILGGIFLLTFLTWAWFAFIRPLVYGKWNAERYFLALYRVILRGSPSELPVIADEFTYSVKSLIRYATDLDELCKNNRGQKEQKYDPPKVTDYANEILRMIADTRFCCAIVESSPGTALVVFNEIGETKKYGVQVENFAKNIMNVAMENKDSFLFKAEGYQSGLIGFHKTLSHAMFANYRLVEGIGTLLDREYGKKWDAKQWEAYYRVVLMTFRDYVENGDGSQSFVLERATGYIADAVSDLYQINGITNSTWDDDVQARLGVIIKFIKDAIKILDGNKVPENLQLRFRDGNGLVTFYNLLARMIFNVICAASKVRSPANLCWRIQFGAVWGLLFSSNRSEVGAATKIVQFKVRRMIYDEGITYDAEHLRLVKIYPGYGFYHVDVDLPPPDVEKF